MAKVSFTVAQAGPHVSVQDGGRPGLLRYGVPASGPMDRLAHQAANVALGNDPGATCLEISAGGLVLNCLEGRAVLALAGGGFVADLDGVRFGSWSVFSMGEGSRLTIRHGPWGSWSYLAFSGVLETETWLGSAATHALSGLGGGRITAGKLLSMEPRGKTLTGLRPLPCPVMARPRHRVRVVLGPQQRFFAAQSLSDLLTEPFALTDAYDRMGVRLSGPPLSPEAELSMPSEAILRGSVQVAGDGVATVLLADHQTTGGYPKIATILSADLDGFVQLRGRSLLRFEAVTPDHAIAIARLHALAGQRYLKALREMSLSV